MIEEFLQLVMVRLQQEYQNLNMHEFLRRCSFYIEFICASVEVNDSILDEALRLKLSAEQRNVRN